MGGVLFRQRRTGSVCVSFSEAASIVLWAEQKSVKRERERSRVNGADRSPFPGCSITINMQKERDRERKRSFSAGSISLKCIH